MAQVYDHFAISLLSTWHEFTTKWTSNTITLFSQGNQRAERTEEQGANRRDNSPQRNSSLSPKPQKKPLERNQRSDEGSSLSQRMHQTTNSKRNQSSSPSQYSSSIWGRRNDRGREKESGRVNFKKSCILVGKMNLMLRRLGTRELPIQHCASSLAGTLYSWETKRSYKSHQPFLNYLV